MQLRLLGISAGTVNHTASHIICQIQDRANDLTPLISLYFASKTGNGCSDLLTPKPEFTSLKVNTAWKRFFLLKKKKTERKEALLMCFASHIFRINYSCFIKFKEKCFHEDRFYVNFLLTQVSQNTRQYHSEKCTVQEQKTKYEINKMQQFTIFTFYFPCIQS